MVNVRPRSPGPSKSNAAPTRVMKSLALAMSVKCVPGGAGAVSVSSRAFKASLSRNTLLLACSSTRSVPLACQGLLSFCVAAGVGACAATDPVAPNAAPTISSHRRQPESNEFKHSSLGFETETHRAAPPQGQGLCRTPDTLTPVAPGTVGPARR